MFVLKSICVESTWMKCPWNPLFLSENGTGCVLLQTLEWWASKTGIQKLEPQSSILSPSVPNVRDCLDFSLNNISDFYKSVHKVCHTVIDTFLTHLSKKNRDTGQWPEHTENTDVIHWTSEQSKEQWLWDKSYLLPLNCLGSNQERHEFSRGHFIARN